MSRKAQHHQSLVETAMRLFRRQGYASTGLLQILSESAVPKGSLYHHFPSGKEGLAEAAVVLAGELITEMLEEHATAHPDDPAKFLSAYCRTMARWMAESDFSSGCPIATTVLETVPQSNAITNAACEVINRWIAVMARVFQASGLSRVEALRSAGMIIAAMEGALILARIRQSTRPILDIPRMLNALAD